MSPDTAILVINCGSSSLKLAIFANDETLPRLFSGAVERIAMGAGFHIEGMVFH